MEPDRYEIIETTPVAEETEQEELAPSEPRLSLVEPLPDDPFSDPVPGYGVEDGDEPTLVTGTDPIDGTPMPEPTAATGVPEDLDQVATSIYQTLFKVTPAEYVEAFANVGLDPTPFVDAAGAVRREMYENGIGTIQEYVARVAEIRRASEPDPLAEPEESEQPPPVEDGEHPAIAELRQFREQLAPVLGWIEQQQQKEELMFVADQRAGELTDAYRAAVSPLRGKPGFVSVDQFVSAMTELRLTENLSIEPAQAVAMALDRVRARERTDPRPVSTRRDPREVIVIPGVGAAQPTFDDPF